MLIAPTDNIIEILIPVHGVRADDIDFSAIAEDFLLVPVILPNLEADLHLILDGIVDAVNDGEYLLVLRLDLLGCVYAALQLFPLIFTDSAEQLSVEHPAPPVSNKAGRIYSIDQ